MGEVGSMKILVVDDERIVLDSCQRVLEAEGFEVSLVPSASAALETMKKKGFGLLLVDIKMPEHDGMYLIREVKKKFPDIPIIVMSGYPTTDTIEEAVKMQAAAFIAKPFTPDEILEIIRQVIQKEENHESKQNPGD
jgi:DNA-binding NtrC family response regulator